jgi:hypothetical protein
MTIGIPTPYFDVGGIASKVVFESHIDFGFIMMT